ncbi:hypothetical protein SK128_003946 [Halocaridina rubra]|uniref:C-type lectin domain-containing protein n=1 Tax=Halocaridina rubra TaxID=373956 RepID=A0AAN9ABG1_HALRR
MTHEDVDELIDCHLQPLTDEDLEEMTKSESKEEEDEQLEEMHEKLKNLILHSTVWQPFQCPSDWMYFNNHCYFLSKDLVTWEEANSLCQETLGSQLTSITNADENSFICDMIDSQNDNCWIGLHDDDNGENWHWLDGSEYDYTHWLYGEPNNADGLEHCGESRLLLICALHVTINEWEPGSW